MGMTMTQKILAAHAGLDAVEPGQLIEAHLDFVFANDVTAPMAIKVFRNKQWIHQSVRFVKSLLDHGPFRAKQRHKERRTMQDMPYVRART